MVRQTVENLRYLCNSQVSRLIVHRVLNVSEMLRWGGEGRDRKSSGEGYEGRLRPG